MHENRHKPCIQDQIIALGSDQRHLASPRSQFLGLGLILALLRGLYPHAQQKRRLHPC